MVLVGVLDVLCLLIDKFRFKYQIFNGVYYFVELGSELLVQLNCFCDCNDLIFFMVLMGVYQILFLCYVNQFDICVGIFIVGCNCVELEGLIGFFINGLVICIWLGGNLLVLEYLK